MENEEEYYREVQTRERLMQIFLIISGFLLAYSGEDFRKNYIPIFSLYILFAIFYYIFLTRSRYHYYINFFGFLSSYMFSLFLLVFFDSNLKTPISPFSFYTTFSALTAIFTFAFLSPETSKNITSILKKFNIDMTTNHPKLSKLIVGVVVILILAYILYLLLSTKF